MNVIPTYTEGDANTLAAQFKSLIRATLTPSEVAEIDRLNAAETDPGICHSHDFCDANEVMLAAFSDVFGHKPGVNEAVPLFNAAWTRARRRGFTSI